MNASGWIFMLSAWLIVGLLLLFCFYNLFKKGTLLYNADGTETEEITDKEDK